MPVERFGVSMDGELLAALDRLVVRKGYANRSEAVRDLVRRELVAEAWSDDNAPVLAAVTLVYDHHSRDVTGELIELQHHADAEIVCSTHVHLDLTDCLEVILCRGTARTVREFAESLLRVRGVKHGDIVMTGRPVAAEGNPPAAHHHHGGHGHSHDHG